MILYNGLKYFSCFLEQLWITSRLVFLILPKLVKSIKILLKSIQENKDNRFFRSPPHPQIKATF